MRSATIGSLTEDAFPRLAVTPMRTTRLCVQLVCTALQRSSELAHVRPFSSTCATLIGPERVSLAAKVRCATPEKLPLHGLVPLLLQVAVPCLPTCSSQFIVTGMGPVAVGTGIVVGEDQTFVVLL